MQVVATDILGPLLAPLVVLHQMGRVYAIPGPDCGKQANRGVVSQVFSPSEQLHSDQGRQFECSLMLEVCRILAFKRAVPYHIIPKEMGLWSVLLNMLAVYTQEHPSTWEDHLQQVSMAYTWGNLAIE